MVKTICHDITILSKESTPAGIMDKPTAVDLMDTLQANKERCVGMAANMIGVNKSIIAVLMGPICFVMYNPKIVKREKPYTAIEACLSVSGEKKTTRYQEIEVEYLDENFKKQKRKYQGYLAQIIQHEIDHCHGVLI